MLRGRWANQTFAFKTGLKLSEKSCTLTDAIRSKVQSRILKTHKYVSKLFLEQLIKYSFCPPSFVKDVSYIILFSIKKSLVRFCSRKLRHLLALV